MPEREGRVRERVLVTEEKDGFEWRKKKGEGGIYRGKMFVMATFGIKVQYLCNGGQNRKLTLFVFYSCFFLLSCLIMFPWHSETCKFVLSRSSCYTFEMTSMEA